MAAASERSATDQAASEAARPASTQAFSEHRAKRAAEPPMDDDESIVGLTQEEQAADLDPWTLLGLHRKATTEAAEVR